MNENSITEPNLYGIMSRLRASGQFELDIGATKDPCGLLKSSKVFKGNLALFTRSLQQGVLALEKGVLFHLKEEINKDQLGFNGMGELVSFISRIFYMDPEELDEEVLTRYEVDKKVQLFLPDIPKKHKQEIYPPESYDFTTPAEISLRIHDKKTKRTLVIGTFPISYFYYGRRYKDLAGAGIDEARCVIHDRTRRQKQGIEKTADVIDQAKQTAETPHLFIRLEDDNSGLTIQSIRGDLVSYHGKIGFDLSTPYDPDIRVFMPFNLPNLGDNPKNITRSQRWIFALTKTLLSTTLKSPEAIRDSYNESDN